MAKDKLTEYDATAANNTVVGDVNLAENSCLPSDVNNAIREVMSHQKEAFGSATPLFVDQTNNRLGIGDSAPDTPVHITKTVNTAYSATNTTSNANNLLKLENPSSTAGVFAGVMFRTGSGADGGLNWVQGSGNDGSFTFTNQNSTDVEMMRIQSNGLVGINTASPSTALDVEGAGVPFSINSNNSNQYKIQLEDAGSVRSYLGASSSAEFVVANSSASERMRIDSSGNLGVATSNPQARVDIRTAALGTALQLSDDTNYGVNMLGVSGGFRMKMNGAQTLTIDQTDNANVFHINGSGNLGIGHTSPTQKLHVSGNAIVTGIARLGDGSASSPAYQFVSDTNTGMFGNGSDMIAFSTGGSERMRVNASGHINIGQSSTNIPGQGNSQAGTSLRSVGDAYFSRDGDLALNVNRNGSDGKVVSFRRGGTEGGSISVTTTSATLASSSDARLKSNIEDSAAASDKIDAIQVRQFDWNETGNHQDYGLIAQELQPIEPLAVVGSPDSDEMMGIDASKLIPMLIKEIQELRSRVAALEE